MQNDDTSIRLEQLSVCQRLGLDIAPPEAMVAVALSSLGKMPVYGSRIPLTDGHTISWFFHCGEYSSDPDFYSPIHTSHLDGLLPSVIKYLSLPYRTRFIIDDSGYEDVWQEI